MRPLTICPNTQRSRCTDLVHWLIAPGFFTSAPVHTALVLSAIAATVCAVVGVFTVLRGMAFAGHALTDVAATGGSGAVLVGASPLTGFLTGAVAGAGAVAVAGGRDARGRDVATGIVLSLATGLSALFLYLDATTSSATGVTQRVLFGSLFSADPSTVLPTLSVGLLALVVTGLTVRPLVLTSLSVELARARGIRVGLVNVVFLATMATAVGLSALVSGSLLSTALLIGPAVAAVRCTTRLSHALVVATALGVGCSWLGILLSYDSYNWMPNNQSLPVSFFVVVTVVLSYAICTWWGTRARRV